MSTSPMERLRQACPDLVDHVMEVDGCCIIWTGTRDAKGYGRAYVKDQETTLAHRVVYQRLHGAAGALAVDHRCAVKACVNPAHLEAVEHGENVRRAAQRRRALAAGGQDIAGCCSKHAVAARSTRRRSRRDPRWQAVEERRRANSEAWAALGLTGPPPADVFEALGKPRFLTVPLPRDGGQRQKWRVIDLLRPTVQDLDLLTRPEMRDLFDQD